MFIKTRQFFREEWKTLLLLIAFFFVMRYELPYVIYTPGGHVNMSERISGEGMYEEEGSISMTYVSMVRGSLPFLLLSKVIPNWDVVPTENVTYDDTDFDETLEIDKIYMREAISNAEYVAYLEAGIDFKESLVHNYVTYKSSEAKTTIKYGDEILSVDGVDYTTLADFQKYVGAKKPGDVVEIKYKRADKEYIEKVELIELDGVAKVGVSIATVSEYETPFNIEIKTKSSESGPSGGFMTALEIYNRIVEEDITKGHKIMGTGTIDKEGHVGEIGGVKYKLLGAYKDGAEVFICPMENYEEALEVKESRKMDILLIGVDNFKSAIEKLRDI